MALIGRERELRVIPTDHAQLIVERMLVEQVLGQLSERDQEALRLSAWEQLTAPEAAAVLGCSVVAFKVRLPQHRPSVPRPRGRTRLITVGEAAVAAAFFCGVVIWPWSGSQPAARAYGVTTLADGSVSVRLPVNTPYDPTLLQQKLRAAGVPAVVLVQSVDGACHEPQPDNIPAAGTIDYADGEDGFTIHPAAMPAGATLIVALPFPGEWGKNQPAAQTPSLIGLSVTAQKPPTCIPQSVFVFPTLTGR